MSEAVLEQIPIPEFIVYETIDVSALDAIEAALIQMRDVDNQSAMTVVNRDGQVTFASDKQVIEPMMEVRDSVRRYQREHGGLIGTTTVHATLHSWGEGNERFYGWHSDNIPEAFVVAKLASTQGLSGTIAAADRWHIEGVVCQEAKINNDLSHIKTLKITNPPANSLIHLPIGIVHRSPEDLTVPPTQRLLVNSVVAPSFLSPSFSN